MSIPKALSSAYQVHVNQFDGPLDLLLHLVQEARLDITEISLAAVASQYFAYLGTMQSLNVEIESSYLLVFAQLLELKSRLLLPELEEEDDYTAGMDYMGEDYQDGAPNEEDPLVDRLAAYALVKEAASWIDFQAQAASHCLPRPCPMPASTPPELVIKLKALTRSYRRLEASPRAPRKPYSLEKVALSVPERMMELWKVFLRRCLANFSELLGAEPSREMVIVTFLALLELAKQRKIHLEQAKTVGNIKAIMRQSDETEKPVETTAEDYAAKADSSEGPQEAQKHE